jgi:hypothetical protein
VVFHILQPFGIRVEDAWKGTGHHYESSKSGNAAKNLTARKDNLWLLSPKATNT